MGNVLDLNDSINQESQFVEVPEGEYDGRIDHVESGICQWDGTYNGNPTRDVYVNLRMPDGSDAQLRDTFVLNSDFEWKLSQLFLGTGQKKKGEPLRPNWDMVVGARGKCEITVNEYQKDGETRKNNRVKNYKEFTRPSFQNGRF